MVRVEIDDIENRQQRKINVTKSLFFEKIIYKNTYLARLKKSKERKQITNTINEKKRHQYRPYRY